jgi:arginyl-tRNA synthetase
MTIEEQILHNLPQAVSNLYQAEMPANTLNLQETRKEFDGQITVVIFPITRFSKKSFFKNERARQNVWL